MKNDKMKNEKVKKKIIKIAMLILMAGIIISKGAYGNKYISNSIEIDVEPLKRQYDYGEEIEVRVEIKNKNRYGKLYYKIKEVDTNDNFSVKGIGKEKEIGTYLETKSEIIKLKDENYKERKNKEGIGRNAYKIEEEKEKEEEKREEEEEEKKKENEEVEEEREEDEKEVKEKREGKGKILIYVLTAIIVVILIIFLYFIIKSRKGKNLMIIILLIVMSVERRTNANIIIENLKYEKEVGIRVKYGSIESNIDVKVEYYFVNTIEEIKDKEKDSDNDMLEDYLEVMYLTDIKDADTDKDLLPDGVEVFYTKTSPLKEDTDNNGIKDGEEDYDKDKLTNKEELENGTEYDNEDTDRDGLTDYEEVKGIKVGEKEYKTDPLKEDTDNDGLTDKEEIKLGLNPLKEKTDGYTKDSERKIKQEMDKEGLGREVREMIIPVNFFGEVEGVIDENVEVKIDKNSAYKEMRGKISEIIKIETRYEEGLKARFDISKFESIKDKIVLCRIEEGEIKVVEKTYIDGQELIGDVRSGEYVLVDVDILLQGVNIY